METFQVNVDALKIIFGLLTDDEKDRAIAYMYQMYEELQEIRLREKLQEETDKTIASAAERLIFNRLAGQLAANMDFNVPGTSANYNFYRRESPDKCIDDVSYDDTDTGATTSEETELDRPRFTCATCGYLANNRKALYRHGIRLKHQTKIEIVGDSSGLYSCAICTYNTDRKFNMDRHLQRAHFGLRNHECPKCPQKFKDKDCLQSHMRRMHNITHLSTLV